MASAPARILFVITTSDFGGTESFLERLVLTLDRASFEPEVLSLCPLGRIGRRLEAEGIAVSSLDLAARARATEMPGAMLRLARHLARRRIDLVQSLLYRANVVAAGARWLTPPRLRRRPPLVTGQRSLIPAGRGRDAFAQRLTRGWADRVVAVSEAVRTELLATEGIDPAKVVVIQNGIDLDRFRSGGDRDTARARFGLPPSAPLVGAVGRFHGPKGLVHLIDAFARLVARRDDDSSPHAAQLVLAGDGPDAERLRHRVTGHRLDHRVRFLGYLEDPSALYPALDVYALPSLAEGSPNALLEAMGSGCAAVASAVGGVPEALTDGEHGLLVPPADPDALATALERLLGDDALRRRLATAARRRVEDEFSLDVMARRHQELYSELLEMKAPFSTTRSPTRSLRSSHDSASVIPSATAPSAVETFATTPSATDPSATNAPAPRAATLDTLRILVVDEDPEDRTALCAQLARLGATSQGVARLDRALDALDAASYDIVLLDIELPELDGLVAVHAIRRHHQRPRLLGMSSEPLAGDREACHAVGIDELLTKPLETQRLRSVLEHASLQLAIEDRALPDESSRELDPRTHADLLSLGDEGYRQILEGARQQMPSQAAAVRAAVEADAADPAATAAHTLLGALSVIGGKKLARAYRAIEQACRRGELPTEARLSHLEARIDKLLAELD
ncbi:MAG: glycosyltransferase [Acidobacteriota bacterium]